MKTLPFIICTSVIRSSQQGESHGGMYIVDFNTKKSRQVLDWNDQTIDWQGRGADRGLRGIAFYDGLIIAAASDEIFFYDQQFNMIEAYKNEYLKHCHEICVAGDTLYLSSTGYDSILTFDLVTREFKNGYCYRKNELVSTGIEIIDKGSSKISPKKVNAFAYNPLDDKGPELKDTHHINNVFFHKGHSYFSGRRMKVLVRINADGSFKKVAKIPKGTHNVQFSKDYLLMNSTDTDSVLLTDIKGRALESFAIPAYDPSTLENNTLGEDHARQSFGRGLCTHDNYIFAGSSPGTISLYKSDYQRPLSVINLTMDVRNAIHGLEVYPYDAAHLFSEE